MSEEIELQGSDNTCYRPSNETLQQGLVIAGEYGVAPLETAPGAPGRVMWGDAVFAYLDAAIDSANTRRSYSRHLRNAGVALGVECVDDLAGADLARYRSQVISNGLAVSSQRQALAALRSFLLWGFDLGVHRLPGRVIAVALKTPKGGAAATYAIVNEREIAALFETVTSPREAALLGILVGGGLRVCETAALQIADVIEDADGKFALHVRQSKGGKSRLVPVGPEVDELIRRYLSASGRYLSGPGALFLADDRGSERRVGGLSPRTMRRLVREMAVSAGIDAKKISPHSLRHSFATRCLRGGATVVAVAKLLGHSNIATTQRYIDHLATSELRASIPALPVRPR